MYERLIEKLRDDSMLENCEFDFVHKYMHEAADVIEELQKQLQKSEENNVYLARWLAEEHARAQEAKGKYMKYMLAVANQSRWIPVTERLPEYMENVLVTDGVFSGMGWRDYYDYHGTKPREDYWIAPSTNVNELGITHWMPLPEPPKEE